MAGNALCEVVVCAEEDLRMLEDELGRIDGKLSPRDPDGPAGRVTSTGYYGSEIMAMPTGTATGTMTVGADSPQPRVLMGRNVPSLPRSPTVRFLPQSASNLGLDGIAKDTPSSEGSQEANQVDGNNRVNDFLLGTTHSTLQPYRWPGANNKNAMTKAQAAEPVNARAMSLLEKLKQSTDLERVGAGSSKPDINNNLRSPSEGGGMGLVAWHRINGPGNPGGSPQKGEDPAAAARRTTSHPPDLTAYNKPYDPTHTQSADQVESARRAYERGLGLSTPPPASWRNSWDPAYTRGRLDGAVGFDGAGAAGAGSYGFNIARPAARGVSATAVNTVLFKEVQDRAAALARAPGRWVVGGEGLTNYDGGRDAPTEDGEDKKDPFS